MRREKRYPLWSVKIVILLSLLSLGLSAGLVFVLGHRSVFVELQITLAVVSVFLFAFLTCGLYMGVRIKNDPLIKGKWGLVRDIDIFDVGSHLNIIEFSDGIAGFIFSLIVWLILSVALLVMFLVLANVLRVGICKRCFSLNISSLRVYSLSKSLAGTGKARSCNLKDRFAAANLPIINRGEKICVLQ